MTSETFLRVLELFARREVLISDHGYDELAADGILVTDVLEGVLHGTPVEHTRHIIRVLRAGAVVITAYRPDPGRWSQDFLRRQS